MPELAMRRTGKPPERTLRLAENLALDETAATQTFGIVARKEGGKTYLASKLVEELYRVKCPVVVIDPVGNWWGLTVAANGKDRGLSFVVLGGEHGDIELSPEGGAVVAELVIARNLNVVLDVSSFSKAAMRRFVADFCERFFERSKKKRQARMVVFEEAQRFAPQQFKGQERMLGAVEDIVRLGRNYGLGCMLISQRPQSVNKEVLSQVECLFAGQINESHARKALLAWIVEKNEDLHSRLDELASLERGQFYCWSPSWLRVFQKVRILPKRTFDASSTPRIGEASSQVEPPLGRLSPAELEALKSAMHADAEGPAVTGTKASREALEREQKLRRESEARAANLTQELAARDELLASVDGAVGKLSARLTDFARELAALVGLATSLPRRIPEKQQPPPPVPTPAPAARVVNGSAPKVVAAPLNAQGSPQPLSKCARALLTVLVQQGKPLAKTRLAAMTGYSASSGSFANTLSELRTKQWIGGRGQDLIEATPLGARALGPVPRLPTGPALFEYWLAHPRLDKCARTILTVLRASPRMLRADIAEASGYSLSSGSFSNSLSRLRTLGLIEGRGELELAPDLR